MKIEDKLCYSEQRGRIYFFREGVFGSIYGFSLYLAVTQLKLRVRVCGHRYKKLGEEMVLRGGMPISWILKSYGHALIRHSFGYELQGDWDVDINDYYNWRYNNLSRLVRAEHFKLKALQVNLPQETVLNHEKNEEDRKVLVAKLLNDSRQLMLSVQEYYFLQDWEPNKYAHEIESRFIEELKKRLGPV